LDESTILSQNAPFAPISENNPISPKKTLIPKKDIREKTGTPKKASL